VPKLRFLRHFAEAYAPTNITDSSGSFGVKKQLSTAGDLFPAGVEMSD
jgi:hypothetical protein